MTSNIGSKEEHELAYWRERFEEQDGQLKNGHYLRCFTDIFELDGEFYRGKRLLDVGCGPRGTLEWADMATERVGIDPLVEAYRAFGIDAHAMDYVQGQVEAMPFPDGHFDVVSSLNNLDHVDDLDLALQEIHRVLRPGGSFLLEVEVGHEPTPTEPLSLWFDLVDVFRDRYDVLLERRYELSEGHNVHAAAFAKEPFVLGPRRRPGLLVAHLLRR